MPLSKNRYGLFRQSTTMDKISMFRSLFHSSELTQGEALALLGSIHSELRQLRGKDGSAYAQYARVMGPFEYGMPEVHQHVVDNWKIAPVLDDIPDDSSFNNDGNESLNMESNMYYAQTVNGTKTESLQPHEKAEENEILELGEEESEEEPEEPEEDEKENEDEKVEEEVEDESEEESEEEDEEEESEEELEDGEEETEEKESEETEEEESEEEFEEEESEEVEEETEEVEVEEEEEVEEAESEAYEESTEVESEAAEGDQMATEAAEAAAHMEEIEYEPLEEEEPPMEAE